MDNQCFQNKYIPYCFYFASKCRLTINEITMELDNLLVIISEYIFIKTEMNAIPLYVVLSFTRSPFIVF